MNPANSKAPEFRAMKAQIAKRQKVSPDRADQIVRGT